MTNSKYSLHTLSPENFSSWDAFVETSPQGTLFHTTKWASIIETVFQRSFEILVLKKNDQISAGMLYWPKISMGIKAITQIANTPYQGIIYTSGGSSKPSTQSATYHKQTKLILEHLIKEFALISIPLSPHIKDIRPFEWLGFKCETKYTYTFPISEPDELNKQFSQDLRRKIKKSTDQSISFQKTENSADLTRFVIESYKEHGTSPAIPENHIEQFMDECLKADCGDLYYQFINQDTVAGVFILKDKNAIYAFYSGISQKKRKTASSTPVHIHMLSNENYVGKSFDFLGANTIYLEEFKRSFGGNLTSYHQVAFSKNRFYKTLFFLKQKLNRLKRASA